MYLGRLERIELSMPGPQPGVLPLNYSRHELDVFVLVMVYQIMAVMTKPGKILDLVICSIFIDVMDRKHSHII